MDNMAQRFRHEELPETWYTQFFERYKATKPYRLSFGDREIDKHTPELMSTYLRILKKHKRRRVAFKEDETNGFGNPMLDNGSNMLRNLVLNDNDAIDDDTYFSPETMFPFNCVPDSALPHINRVEENHKVDFNGVLDMLPQIMTRSPIMIERLGIRPEYLRMEQGGNQCRGKNGSHGNRKLLSQEQASEMSRKVIARVLTNVGFEASSEVPMEVLSQLLSCHIGKLGRILKVLYDSYRKQCSAIELLKMFLQIAGYSNLGALAELVKDSMRNSVQQTHQQMQVIQSQIQSQQQAPLRQPQQHQLQRLNDPGSLEGWQGRTGLMVSAYLVYSGMSAEEALQVYAHKRTTNNEGRYVGYWENTLSIPRGVDHGPPSVNSPEPCSRELVRIRLYDTVNTGSVFFVVSELQEVPGQRYCPPVEVFKSCCREVKKGCVRPNSSRYYLSFVDQGGEGNRSEPVEPHLVVQMDTESSVLYQKTCLDYCFEKPIKLTGDVRVIFYEKMIGGRLFYACFNTAFIRNSLLQFSVRDLDKIGKKGKSICGPAFCLELLFGPSHANYLFSASSGDFSED